MKRLLILGAAGRDFHNFNVLFVIIPPTGGLEKPFTSEAEDGMVCSISGMPL
jgi:hypothetical protein